MTADNISFPAQENLLIRELRPDDAISGITALLHMAYAPLARMGFRYLASHQDDAITRHRLQRGFPLVAEFNGVLVATVTLYPPTTQSQCLWYRQPGVYCFGQFAVHPQFQQRGIGQRLVDYVEKQACDHGACELALDTAEGASHLRQWYERMGFRFIEYVSWPETNYRSVVLSKSLRSSV